MNLLSWLQKKLPIENLNSKPKVVAIVGPTSSGKSDIAVAIAKKFDGEIISADSRQLYKGLVVGTGAVTPDPGSKRSAPGSFLHQNTPHHMIGVVDPKKQYTVAQYQKDAGRILEDIITRKKLPIIEGGAGQYVNALLYEQNLPKVPPRPKLRKRLRQYSTEELFEKLNAKDPRRAKSIDPNNKRRLVRALEIIETTGKPVPPRPGRVSGASKKSPYNILKLGINVPRATLKERIKKRLLTRLKEGLVEEVKELHRPPAQTGKGLSWKRMEQLGLEYRWVSRYVRNQIDYNEMVKRLTQKIWGYAKRQLTWFKRDEDIVWVENEKEALEKVREFLHVQAPSAK